VQRKSGKNFEMHACGGFPRICTVFSHLIWITGFGFRRKFYYSPAFVHYTNWGGFGALPFALFINAIRAAAL
jgi:hypothetical protein